MRLTGCPKRVIPAEAWEVLDHAELYAKGLAPEPGGSLDQAACFVSACRFVWAENARIRADAMERLED